ncbi:copper amine oxidase N-terminal domain-containing protein [Paenibacillus wulumuqiensis]|uniref:copper amine oxidase N-terminal domain-containing protein n=1 Tax=Paenibacillus wulumuqiensis TaxID=1567107 RepID=UPI0006193EDE|nr:copper amine oxidase N-terminal domain-containing protein [Paenibacillus wulumuqiensis]
MNKWVRIAATGLLASIITITTAYAGVHTAAAAELLELKIKKDSTAATINGEKETIIKPYEDGGTTMVQLGLFSRAFHADVQLHENNTVQLTSGKHIISMKIGSKAATINGKKVTLDAAPVMKSNTLMVPLRSLVQGIGGKMKVVSGQIIITLPASAAQTGESGSANEHADKNLVGSSQYQWTINYPEDLVYMGGSSSSTANFMNRESTYLLQVSVESDTVNSSVYGHSDAEDLLDYLVGYNEELGETVLDQQVMSSPAGDYARVISRSEEGYLSENRLYSGNGNLYYVMYADSEAYSYKDFDGAADLLDSFRMSFDNGNKTVEDITSTESGEEPVVSDNMLANEEYGISASLPSNWSVSSDTLEAGTADGSYTGIYAYSAPAGATVQDWAKQIQTWFSDNFTPDHYRHVSTTERQIGEQTAVVNQVQYTYDGDIWYTEYQILFQRDDYRYYMEYGGMSDSPTLTSDLEAILPTVSLDFDTLQDNFGKLPVDYYSEDRSKTVTRASKTYGYSLQVPRYWISVGNDYESSPIAFQHSGGTFRITIANASSLDKAVEKWKATFQGTGVNAGGQLSEGTATTFAGEPAYTFTAAYPDASTPYQASYTIFNKGKRTYILSSELNTANNTPFHQSEIAKVLSSFQWLTK